MIDEPITIQEVATLTGLSAHTLRYYERIGLIPPIERDDNGYRCYNEDSLGWISLLTCLRATGMPIAKMLEYAQLQSLGDATIDARLAVMENHRQDVLDQIESLQHNLEAIEAKIAWYKQWKKEHKRTMKRKLGRSGIEVSAVGMGCWAIGGPWRFLGGQAGWGETDDEESIKAIHCALEMGANLFDTAANYGCGHSERLLARALEGRRDQAVIATKFGYLVDEQAKSVSPYDGDEEHGDVASRVREDCEASLKRLNTDYIDVYQLHIWGYDLEKSYQVRDELEELVKQGKIKCYGWSTDRPEAVEAFAEGEHCAVVQQQLNIFDGVPEILDLCDEYDLASLNRGPLGMGILTGKFSPDTTFAQNDVRKHAQWFPGFKDGKPNPAWLDALDAVRDILTSEGRTLAQGALAWIWGRSDRTIPIPGFKNVEQVQDNVGAMQFGPLTPDQMAEIDGILSPLKLDA
jgi:aryl-alcohol dehydrogenase-like predicted oxidoreductase/DNA-binding transcriptional MerR regulator